MKKNKYIIASIICVLIFLITFLLKNNEMRRIDNERISISNLLEYNDNYLNRLSYVDIHVTPYLIAEYENDSNGFYVVYDNNYYSILYMKKKEALKITKDMVDKGFRIYGITKEKPEGMEKYGVEFLKKLFATHDENDGHNHNVTEDNYEEYFGTIYLDATMKYEGLTIYNIIMGIFGISSVLLLLFALKIF